MKTGWILYDRGDYEPNRAFAEHVQAEGLKHDLAIRVVLTDGLAQAIGNPPEFVISRQRDWHISARLESMGVPVFNNAKVCELCNDKRSTHAFLQGLPLMKTEFPKPGLPYTPAQFPAVIKPAFGHGGDRVSLVQNQAEADSALKAIYPMPALAQKMASSAGKDLRVYVLFGEIVAAVLRTAKSGIVSNFKRGGKVELHVITQEERELAQRVISRFTEAGACLSFAGIDLIYHQGVPVVNEIEDVVGSRMLYQVSDIDIVALYLERLAKALAHDNLPEI